MKINGLEILRALAAMLVFLNHLTTHITGFPQNQLLQMMTSFATEAVIIFFVLSGAVISISQERHPTSVVKYLYSRFMRIYPIYLISIGVSIVVLLQVFPGRKTEWSLIIGNLLFLQTLGGYIVSPLSTNDPLWSLSYEMAFYITFSLVILYKRMRWIWAALSLISGLLSYFYKPESPVGAHIFSVLVFSFFWLVGHFIFIYRKYINLEHLGVGVMYFIIGLLFSRSFYGGHFEYYNFMRLGAFSICCSVLIASIINARFHFETGILPTENLKSWIMNARWLAVLAVVVLWRTSESSTAVKMGLSIAALSVGWVPLRFYLSAFKYFEFLSKPLIFVGSISYALYVLHYPLIIYIDYIFREESVIFRIFFVVGVVLVFCVVLERYFQPLLGRFMARAFFTRQTQ